MQSYSMSQNKALFILRLIVAAIFVVAGYTKFPLWGMTPETTGMSDWLLSLMKFLSIAEIAGALALVAGLLTRTAALCLGIIMLGAILVMQFMMQVGFVTPTGAGWNFPLMVLAGCVILFDFGPGKWSVDAGMGKKW